MVLRRSQAIRGMLGSKYGKEYIAEASSDTYCRKWVVNENLIRCADPRHLETGARRIAVVRTAGSCGLLPRFPRRSRMQ